MRMLQKGLSNAKTPAKWCGFKGYAENYDNGGVEHSFMYTDFIT